MAAKKYYAILTFFLIIVLFANTMNVQSVRADGETPTEPPAATDVATEPPAATDVPTEPPTTETQAPAEVTPTSVDVAPTAETVVDTAVPAATDDTVADTVVSQAPQNTDIVVLDGQGQALTLGSQETANA